MALAIPTYAQKSPPCSVGPCAQVGVMGPGSISNATFATDKHHFIYCAEDEVVMVDVLATFRSGTTCRDCDHSVPPPSSPPEELRHPAVVGYRTWQWVVQGASSYEILSDTVGSERRMATFALAEAGDTVTITAIVSETVEGQCHEGRNDRMGEHRGNHLGATATCTIKLWRMDMEANKNLDTTLGYPFYTFEFAQNTTSTATVIGATPVEYRWRSTIDSSLHAEVVNTSNTWAGEIVASTGVDCRAKVINGCDTTQYAYMERLIHLFPAIRRPGWTMDVTLTGADYNWQQGNENWFPGNVKSRFLAANTNVDEDYIQYSDVVVTPIYGETNEFHSPSYPDYDDIPVATEEFESVIDEVESGPCIGLWYNINPDLYKVDRTILVNYWVTPDAEAPSTPALDPDGDPYTNWLQVQADQFGDFCICSNPSGHGGDTTDIRFVSLTWHEGFGAPLSPNAIYLGHQAQLEDAVFNGPKIDYDAVWRCDLQYATSPSALLAIDEAQRAHVQANLLPRMASVHSFINGYWNRHNFNGHIYVYGPLTNTWDYFTYTN